MCGKVVRGVVDGWWINRSIGAREKACNVVGGIKMEAMCCVRGPFLRGFSFDIHPKPWQIRE